MDKATEELINAIQLANQGGGEMWLPITTLTVVFGLLISLLLAFWKQSQKVNDKRHEDSEDRHKASEDGMIKANETLSSVNEVLVELRTNQKHHSKSIDKLSS